MEAARKNRWGHRDATMVLVAYRHGLRAAEACDLHWDQVDFTSAVLQVVGPGGVYSTVTPRDGAEPFKDFWQD